MKPSLPSPAEVFVRASAPGDALAYTPFDVRRPMIEPDHWRTMSMLFRTAMAIVGPENPDLRDAVVINELEDFQLINVWNTGEFDSLVRRTFQLIEGEPLRFQIERD